MPALFSKRKRVLILLLMLSGWGASLFFGWAAPADVQAADHLAEEASVESHLIRRHELLDRASRALASADTTLDALKILRTQVDVVRQEATRAAAREAKDLAAVLQQLEALGARPEAGSAPESKAISRQRLALEERRAVGEGRIKQLDLILVRAEQIRARIAYRLRAQSARQVLERTPSPLSWGALHRIPAQLAQTMRKMERALREEWPPLSQERRFAEWTVPFLVLIVLFFLALRSRFLRRLADLQKTRLYRPAFRIRFALYAMVAHGGSFAFAASIAPAALLLGSIERAFIGDFLVALSAAAVIGALANGIGHAALAPEAGAWRIASLGDAGARSLRRRIMILVWSAAILYAIEYPFSRNIQVAPELGALASLLADCVLVAGLLSLLPSRLWRVEPHPLPAAEDALGVARPAASAEADAAPSHFLRLRVVVGALAIPVPPLALAGFDSLASYLAINLVATVAISGIAVIVYGLVREAVTVALIARHLPDPGLQAKGGRSVSPASLLDDTDTRLRFWLMVAAKFLLLTALAIVLLLQWGVSRGDLKEWIQIASSGFEFGSLRLSVLDLSVGALVFVVLLVSTRWLQSTLERRFFPQTRLAPSIRHSLKVSVGYAGLFIATLAAISVIGIDLSNIAIIAGALSVGIGFGLQNIVNNFVSGLILLIERPVKAGDWIRVGEHQGFVQRIKVRATEIETFQRYSVIIPNAELLSSSVINLTYRDATARVDIPVGVAYDSDAESVRKILLEAAASHAQVMRRPAPFVLFCDFAASSLDFELRCFIPDARNIFFVATDLRFDILRRFREQGIEIPFPQRVVHIQDSSQALPKRHSQAPDNEADNGPDNEPDSKSGN